MSIDRRLQNQNWIDCPDCDGDFEECELCVSGDSMIESDGTAECLCQFEPRCATCDGNGRVIAPTGIGY